MKDNSSSQYLSTLLEKRCEIYSQVAEHILAMEEAIDNNRPSSLLEAFEKIRKIIRTSLPFLTEKIFYELECLEALILPHKKRPKKIQLEEVKTRLSLLHVQFSRSLKNPESQNIEEILSLPDKIRKEIEESEKEFEALKKREKNRKEAKKLSSEAEKWVEEKKFRKAVKNYQRATQLCPDMAVYHNDLGVVYAFQGALVKAQKEYKKALELNEQYPENKTPQWTLTHYNLAKVYRRLGDENLKKDELKEARENFKNSMKHLDEYLKLSPQGSKVDPARQLKEHLKKECEIIEVTLNRLKEISEQNKDV